MTTFECTLFISRQQHQDKDDNRSMKRWRRHVWDNVLFTKNIHLYIDIFLMTTTAYVVNVFPGHHPFSCHSPIGLPHFLFAAQAPYAPSSIMNPIRSSSVPMSAKLISALPNATSRGCATTSALVLESPVWNVTGGTSRCSCMCRRKCQSSPDSSGDSPDTRRKMLWILSAQLQHLPPTRARCCMIRASSSWPKRCMHEKQAAVQLSKQISR